MSECQVLIIDAQDYKSIIEAFHRVELQHNIQYLSELSYFRYFNYEKIEQFAKCFNSKHLNKGDILISEGSKVDTMYILRQGGLDVEKIIKIEQSNYWPVKANEWE
jgi:hypothetical protein